jgi:maltose alpha-D-glucosyltransferase/alpha-amylase
MQWNHTENFGFSGAPSDRLYLPQDGAEDAPSVEDQLDDPNSLLSEVRRLVALRHAYEDLQADASFAAVNSDENTAPFVYARGELLLAINPSSQVKRLENDLLVGREIVHSICGPTVEDDCLTMPGQSFAVLRVQPAYG